MLNLGHLLFGRCIDCGVLQNYDFCDGSIVAQVLVLVGAKMQSLQVSGELVTTTSALSSNSARLKSVLPSAIYQLLYFA